MAINNNSKLEVAYMIFIFLISIMIMFSGFFNSNTLNYTVKKGVVVNTSDDLDYQTSIKIGFQNVYVKVDNKIIEFHNVLRGNWLLDTYFQKGDSVDVIYEYGKPIYLTYDRVFYLTLLFIVFIGLILIIGRVKGIKTVTSLLFTISSIFYVLLPLIAKGYPPIPLTIVVVLAIVFITFTLLCGFNRKAISSSLGTVLGTLIGGLVGCIGISLMKLPPGGFSEFVQMILFSGHYLDFYGILISAIILSSLGAIMDVAIDISSGLYELKRHKKDISFNELFESGMNIGKDIMGTMSNTLILVYVGTLIAPILYFMIKQTPIEIILGYNFIATEILMSLAGSIGVVMTIPITAFIAAYLYSLK